jgi:hypothetical protein
MISLIIVGAAIYILDNILILGNLLVRDTVEPWPDTPKAQEVRRKSLFFWIDHIGGQCFNPLDTIYGLIKNAIKPKSEDAQGSRWKLTRVVMWRPGMGNTYATYSQVAKMLSKYGIICFWWGFDGHQMYFHVRETQARHAIYRLTHGDTGRSWAEQRRERERAARPTLLDRLGRLMG